MSQWPDTLSVVSLHSGGNFLYFAANQYVNVALELWHACSPRNVYQALAQSRLSEWVGPKGSPFSYKAAHMWR